MVSGLDRFAGSLVGLAVGDALGEPLESDEQETFAPVADMRGGGYRGLEAGTWTDDTSMALCLAESLAFCGGFDAKDQMDRYVRWYKKGYMSSTGSCFGIGRTTRDALEKYRKTVYMSSTGSCFGIGRTTRDALGRHRKTGDEYSGPTDADSAGNGSIMRLAPVPLFFAPDATQAIRMSGRSSITTHRAPECVDACRYLGALIAGAARGEAKDALLSERYGHEAEWEGRPLCEKIDAIAAGSFKDKEPPDIRGTGYVVESLEAALWAFYKSSSFKEGCLMAVNLGDDADTTGAVFGQLAGAYYGIGGIPPEWRGRIVLGGMIERTAAELLAARDGRPR